MKLRFQKIIDHLLVEGFTKEGDPANTKAEFNEVVAEAIRLTQADQSLNPKYFKGDGEAQGSHQEVLAKIDGIGRGDAPAGTDADAYLRLLYTDFFYLCMALKPQPGLPATAEDANVDIERIERLFDAASKEVQMECLESLGALVDVVLKEGPDELASSPAKLRAVVMMLSHPKLAEVESEPWTVLKKFLGLMKHLHEHVAARDTLVRWFASMPVAVLESHVSALQTFITVSLLMAQGEHGLTGAQGPEALKAVLEIARSGDLARHIRNALRLMDILWRANECRRERAHDWRTRRRAQLAKQGGEHFDDASIQVVDVSQFHNDAVNECETILKHDLRERLEAQGRRGGSSTQKDEDRKDFGLVEFPFVLTAVSKVRMLNIESMLRQRDEVRTAMLEQIFRGRGAANPFLVLKVRRSDVVTDALQGLAGHGAQHFKRPLKIVFDGEEGVDEGGVQKEFFQLLIEQLYNEDFGMFERIDESRNFWFNKNSFEANLQFELFGIVLGLAIYNQVILDVKFPSALYKKLMMTDEEADLGLSDLMDFQPSLAKGLMALLEFDGAGGSFEDVFGPLFFVCEYECYGSMVDAELKEGGKDIAVSMENREDYIKRYCDWIFNTGVSQQYKAFRRGFDQCINDTLFRQLFRPDELELIICGTVELDFDALEKVCQYQDGFTAESQVMKWFWEVVHSLTPDDKKLFLQFCTGCDRAPVGGLGRIPYIVSRAGPDSSILPTVHTCFNHILVPEYSSKEKLERSIRLAIQHSTGFGLM